jgi:hypothetical protein
MPRIPDNLYPLPQAELNPLPGPRLDTRMQPNALSVYGETAVKIGDVFAERQDAYNKSEAMRIAGNTIEQSKSIIQKNAQEVPDPDEFTARTYKDLGDLFQSSDGIANPQIKDLAKRQLQRHQLEANRHVEAMKFVKQKDQTKRGVEDSFQTYARLAIESETLEERNSAKEAYNNFLGYLEARGFLGAEQAGEYSRLLDNRITEGRAQRFAVELKGDLDGYVNSVTTGQQGPNEAFRRGSLKIDSFTDIALATREDLKRKYKDSLWTGAVEGEIERDPIAADKKLRAGEYNDKVDPQSLRFLKNKAASEIDRMARQMEAVHKEQERRIGKAVDDFAAAALHGFQWSGNLANLRSAVKGTEHEDKFNEVMRDSEVLLSFNQYGPLAQEQYLRSQAQTAKSGADARLYGKLEAAHNHAKEALKNDALTYAIRQRSIPALMPFNLNNPASLSERSTAAALVENRYGVPASPLSDDEAQSLSQSFAKAPADKQVDMMRQLRSGLGDRYVKAVAGQISKKKDDPVLAFAMGLSGDSPEAASRILRGREILRDNKEIMPKGADLKTAQDKIASSLSEAFKHNPEHYAAVSDAAMTIYAFKAWQSGKRDGVFDSSATTLLGEAIKEASGGVITVGRGWFGGGSTVQPPKPGMTEDQFMERVRRADYSKAKGFKAADIEKHGIFESVGDGRYMVKIGPGYVLAEKGGPFILDLNFQPASTVGAKSGGLAGLVK